MSVKLSLQGVQDILKELSRVFAENKDYLNDLDTKIGDGDHGLSMSRGFSAVLSFLNERKPETISSTFIDGGMQFNEAAGSTIGILMFSAMREAGKTAVDKKRLGLADLKSMLGAAVRGIQKRGKAEPGQKTILDSLHPALKALEEGLKGSVPEEMNLVKDVMAAAADGAEHTRELESRIGRAKWFSERSRGEIDPGAVSGYLIIKTVGEYLLKYHGGPLG
jgi:dihydroxyacetone kinase-like protein